MNLQLLSPSIIFYPDKEYQGSEKERQNVVVIDDTQDTVSGESLANGRRQECDPCSSATVTIL